MSEYGYVVLRGQQPAQALYAVEVDNAGEVTRFVGPLADDELADQAAQTIVEEWISVTDPVLIQWLDEQIDEYDGTYIADDELISAR